MGSDSGFSFVECTTPVVQFIGDYKLLLYGSLLFAVMRFSPGGLAGLAQSLFPNSQKTFAPKENQ